MAKVKKLKVIRVPKTTANIQRGIINFLRSKGHFAYRSPSVGVWDPVKKIFRKGQGERGVGDITCCMRYRKEFWALQPAGTACMRFNVGLYVAIEIKNDDTGDTQNQAQKEFQKNIADAGGTYIITPDVESFVKWYNAQEFANEPPIKTLPA